MHAVRANAPSNWVNWAAWNPTNTWSRDACVGAFGSSVSPGPVRKLSQAVDATPTSSAASALRVRTVFMVAPALTVQGDGERERAGLRIVEIIHTAQAHLRPRDRKSTRLNSSHSQISYAVFCLKKKKKKKKRNICIKIRTRHGISRHRRTIDRP